MAVKKRPEVVEIPKRKLLAITGEGKPGGEAFVEAIGALYTMAWSIKMKRKFAGEETFKVAALEGIYPELDDPSKWTLCIEVPDFVGAAELKKTAAELVAKGKPAAVKNVGLLAEKKAVCAQMLHVGPYDQECPTVEALQAFTVAQGYEFAGPHREIYYSDPGRVAPEKLKTGIRYPVKKT